jgi:glycosyltransferase involved in cell wall biosynthesis
MRIAMVGTRGVPAQYGGFETAVEEIGKRLVQRGHQVLVYTRPADPTASPQTYLGMRLVPRPCLHSKSFETLTHTAGSTAHVLTKARPDMVFLFNAANAIYLLALGARDIPTAMHMDGLEWRRLKWGPTGQRFYRMSESLAVRYSDALIADAPGIAQYYRDEFGAATELISYGAPILDSPGSDLLPANLTADGFHLVVARFEPENHLLEIVQGYVASRAELPLVVIGSAPFSDEYTRRVHAAAQGDSRVIFLGGVWDQQLLDQYYANARTYVHGHSVGGTNPSLLRAMGAATPVITYDVIFNRGILGSTGRYFSEAGELPGLLEAAEADGSGCQATGLALRRLAEAGFDWDTVATQYEELAASLVAGQSQRGSASGRRNRSSSWH